MLFRRSVNTVLSAVFFCTVSPLFAQDNPPEEPLPVFASPLGSLLVGGELRAAAEVIAANQSVLASQLLAPIASVEKDVTNPVAKGEILATLDCSDFQLTLDQAQAALAAANARIEQAEQRLKRAQSLSDNAYISADDLLGRETDVAVLKADAKTQQALIRLRKNDIAKCEIRAPYDGVVIGRTAQVGALVSPGSPLFTVVQTADRQVSAKIPFDKAAQLRAADSIVFRAGERSWPVSLIAVSPTVISSSRTREIRLGFGQAPADIGLGGEVIATTSKDSLPADLLLKRGDEYGIYVVRDGIANWLAVDTNNPGKPVTVELPADTQVVTTGAHRLNDGQRVRIVAQ